MAASTWLRTQIALGFGIDSTAVEFDPKSTRALNSWLGITANDGGGAAAEEGATPIAPVGTTLFVCKGSANDADQSAAAKEGVAGVGRVPLRCTLNRVPARGTHGAGCVMFFIKRSATLGAAELKHVEFGISGGANNLNNLRDVICDVFLPVVEHGLPLGEQPLDALAGKDGRKRREPESRTMPNHVSDTLRNELRASMQKFASQIKHAMQQVSGDVHLHVPSISVDEPEAVSEDYETVQLLESALEEWSKCVAMVVDSESRKTPIGSGPLAEIEFWRQRNAALSTLFEQISTKRCQQMLEVLDIIDANMMPTFRYHFSELTKVGVRFRMHVCVFAAWKCGGDNATIMC